MIYGLKGTVINILKDSIAINVHDVYYEVFVSDVDKYHINDIISIFTYEVIREDDRYLIGFSGEQEKSLFTKLINVKGIGPKMAINALKGGNAQDIEAAIEATNVLYLKKLPGIGEKAAKQIILDIKGQLVAKSKINVDLYDDVKEALKGLGYKTKTIEEVLLTINEPGLTQEQIILLALQKLGK